tara:strand:+ start:610 stop:1041 length:432 start_codon:yes stop_codon:yes gene_type:complete
MSSVFKLPIDAIKDEYVYQILKKTEYKTKVQFNIENPTFYFTIDLSNKTYNNVSSNLKNVLKKQIKLIDNQNKDDLKILLNKIITKLPEKNNSLKSIISNLKSMNNKLEINDTNSEEYEILSESEHSSDNEIDELDEILNSLS